MPEICQDIDFSTADQGLKDECGVQSRNYLAYRNIPEHRNLLMPKGGKIVEKEGGLQLRLEGFLPCELPKEFNGQIEFSERLRRQMIRSRMDYHEYFRSKAKRPEKLFKLEIPIKDSSEKKVCFFVERPPQTSQRKVGFASRLLPLPCEEFDRRKEEFLSGSDSSSAPKPKNALDSASEKIKSSVTPEPESVKSSTKTPLPSLNKTSKAKRPTKRDTMTEKRRDDKVGEEKALNSP